MANTYSTTLDGDNSTDAKFRAWGKWVDDQLLAMGFTQVADSGATASNGGTINWTTVTKPGATSTMVIYSIFRCPDGALQTSHPLFFRIDYGSGRTSANNPGIKLQMGQGSDGAGALTGPGLSTQVFMDMGTTAVAKRMLGCGLGSEGRFAFHLWDDSGSDSINCFFGIERSRDASTAVADGNYAFMWAYGDAAYMNQAGRGGITVMMPNNGCAARSGLGMHFLCNMVGTGQKGSNWSVYPVYPQAGTAPNCLNLGPLYGLVIVPTAAITANVTFTTTHYGATRTFMPGLRPSLTTANTISRSTLAYAVTPAMLWE